AQKYIAARKAELTKLVDPHDAYINALVELSNQMEAAVRRYGELAAEPEVKAALASLNEKLSAKVKLGPSEQLAQELQRVRFERDKINSAVIELQVAGGVGHVNATLNGKVTRLMLL